MYTETHRAIMDSMTKHISAEINPHVDEWEAKGMFPAREVFQGLGKAGFLGLKYPVRRKPSEP